MSGEYPDWSRLLTRSEIYPELFNRFLEFFSSRKDASSLLEKMKSLELLYEEVFDARRKKGLPLITDEAGGFNQNPTYGSPTDTGTYSGSDWTFFPQILPALEALKSPRLLLDAGSGMGQFILRTALLCPSIPKMAGIEYDPLLYQESCEVLEIASREGLIEPGRIKFYQGDFNSDPFEPLFREADAVYYYQSGTRKLFQFERTLLSRLKPSARVISYGSDPEPFPDLAESGHFFRLEDFSVAVYERSRGVSE